MKTLSLEEYRIMELHYYNLESYIEKYRGNSNSKTKGQSTITEIGSDSKKTIEKYHKLKAYQSQLSNYLHKQSRLVFPTLSELRND